LNLILLKNITVRGVELRTWVDRLPEETAQARAQLELLVAGGLRPLVGETYDLEDVAAALDRVATRKQAGKVVITIQR
jgi:NADPH2:quinone reductase